MAVDWHSDGRVSSAAARGIRHACWPVRMPVASGPRLTAWFAVQTRIQNYQNEAPEKLNEDQKRLLKTLPSLEAVSKELEEVKKAIEVRGSGLIVAFSGGLF